MRALAPIVQTAGRSLPRYVVTEGFKVSGTTAHVEAVDSLEDAAAQLPEPVNAASLNYSTKLMTLLWGRPLYDIDLEVFKGSSKYSTTDRPEAKVKVELSIKGPIGDSTAGLIDRVRRQVETEVARQNNAGWTAPPIHGSATQNSTSGDHGQEKFWTNGRKWIAGVATTLFVTIAGGLTVEYLKPDDPLPQAPATTSSQTPTPSTATTPTPEPPTTPQEQSPSPAPPASPT